MADECADCCGPDQCCCTNSIPLTLTATVEPTDLTGCDCNSFTPFVVVLEYSFLSGSWFGEHICSGTDNSPYLSMFFSCNESGGVCTFGLTGGDGGCDFMAGGCSPPCGLNPWPALGDTITLVSSQCDPLEVVFDIDIGVTSGSFTITITE